MERSVILASASPRRRELMQMLGVQNLVICPAKGEEHIPEDAGPEEIVCALSGAKAKEVWERCPDGRAVVRFATSWATTPEQIDALAALLP